MLTVPRASFAHPYCIVYVGARVLHIAARASVTRRPLLRGPKLDLLLWV